MSGPEEQDEIDIDEAAGLLEVPVEQVRTMVDQELLREVDGPEDPRFVRAEVLALRQMGG